MPEVLRLVRRLQFAACWAASRVSRTVKNSQTIPKRMSLHIFSVAEFIVQLKVTAPGDFPNVLCTSAAA
jgi:hypothetical protein